MITRNQIVTLYAVCKTAKQNTIVARAAEQADMLLEVIEMVKDINPDNLSLGFGVFVRNLQTLLGVEPKEDDES